ncbi:hypothetical protein LMG28727_06628 [Paraburkholderia kirstenboschensis]|nr:hypothetical protein LMG28727_06628 [Paraburkholderia kirstenboschensis]
MSAMCQRKRGRSSTRSICSFSWNIRVTLSCDMHAGIDAEPVLSGILLDDLLNNAMKYGSDGGNMEIAVH